jgi:DNA-binding transcriptional MerR regulator
LSLSSPAFAFAEKSPEAFRSISEVAGDLDLPQHVLRFWESRFAQIKPIKRAGGRRYYRPEDIDLLRGIRALLYSDGLTIKGVQKVLKDRGNRHVAEIGRGARFSVSPPLPPMPRPVSATQAVLALQPIGMFEEQAPPFANAEEKRAQLELLLNQLMSLKAKLRASRR